MISISIQAGGRSSRMGTDKGLVLLGGRPMVARVMERVQALGDELVVTTNNQAQYAPIVAPYGARMAADAAPGAGALPGLQTALRAATGAFVLVVACDMPFLNEALLAHLLSLREAADVVVPLWDDRHQPMHAVYRREPVLAAVDAALAAGRRRMISFYDAVRVRTVPAAVVARFDPSGRTFFNVNTPDELATAEALLAH